MRTIKDLKKTIKEYNAKNDNKQIGFIDRGLEYNFRYVILITDKINTVTFYYDKVKYCFNKISNA